MSKLSIIEEVGVISGANYIQVEDPFKVEEEVDEDLLEVTEPWQDRPEYDDNGEPNQ